MSKWSSFEKQQLLTESWRKFLNEAPEQPPMGQPAETTAPGPSAGGINAKDLLNLDLPSFINSINTNQKAALKTLMAGLQDGNPGDDKFKIVSGALVCSSLRPTQNEVVVNKSLEFSLTNPKSFIKYRSSDGPFEVGPKNNNAIITFNSKYVIDGHHRWSSLYCCNPNAKIQTFDLQMPGFDPTNVLKAVQTAIAFHLKGIPANKGGGVNLFTVDEARIKQYIHDTLSSAPGALTQFAEYLKQQQATREQPSTTTMKEEILQAKMVAALLHKIIWPNIQTLQQKSPPISGATARPSMPQADKVAGVVAGGETPKALKPLERGEIDVKPPHAGDPGVPLQKVAESKNPRDYKIKILVD